MVQHGIHSTFDTHSALCMDQYECHSGSFKSFTAITPGHKIVLLAAATTTWRLIITVTIAATAT